MKIVIMPSWYESSENEQEGAFLETKQRRYIKQGMKLQS